MSDLSDLSLLRAYLKGDRAAFDALFRRYSSRVHATAYRLTGAWEDAEEVLQDVFVSLSRKAGTIRRGEALSAWIYRATYNRAMDKLRARRQTVSLDEVEVQTGRVVAIQSIQRDADREEARKEDALLAKIEIMIPRLPERQAAAFVLRHFQGLTHREIGAVLGCTEGASKSHHSLACSKLREWIAEEERAERAEEGRKRRERRENESK